MTELFLQLSNGLGLLGYWVIGSKRRVGFVAGFASEIAWTTWGALAHQPGIYPWCVVWAVVNGRNWWRWKNNRESPCRCSRGTKESQLLS